VLEQVVVVVVLVVVVVVVVLPVAVIVLLLAVPVVRPTITTASYRCITNSPSFNKPVFGCCQMKP
jgi:hypothetical protein